jgi:soluble lytic murein transglycosylase-like protein
LVRCEAQPDPARVEAAAQHVRAAARTHDVDPALVAAVIWVESKFNPRARGPGGSAGLMQLMPRTSRSLAAALHRAHRPWDAGFNVDAGTYYLARLLRRFGGDETLALAAYNRGPGAVAKWTAAGSDLPEGARAYAARVLAARPCFATL